MRSIGPAVTREQSPAFLRNSNPGTAGAGGPLAAARGHDDDPRAVGRRRDDVGGEEGVLRVPLLPAGAVGRARLQPGRMFLVDTEQGRIIGDDELKRQIASERPYAEWLREHLVSLEQLP